MKTRSRIVRCLRVVGWIAFFAILCVPNMGSYTNSRVLESTLSTCAGHVANIITQEMIDSMNDSLEENPVREESITPSDEVSVPNTEPYLQFTALYPDIGSVRIGETVTIKGEYTAVNCGSPPNGTISLSFDGKQVGNPKNLGFSQEGQVKFEKPLTMPQGLKDGKYDVNIQIEYCGKTASKPCAFSIVK